MSNSFSSIELKFARFLSNFPGLKRKIKSIYSRLIFFINKPKETHWSERSINTINHGTDETFFGYYDKSPVNKTNEFIIFQSSASATNASIKSQSSVNVVAKNFKTNELIFIAQTYSFNWQQGTKLHWIDDYKFIYNDFDICSNKYVSHVVDVIEGEIISTFPCPVYDSFGDKFAVTLNFDRLTAFSPDYGYFTKKFNDINDELPSLENDGVFILNFSSGKYELVISLAEMSKDFSNSKDLNHTVNHIMISPDGSKFIFIHRWYQNAIRKDRLFLFDISSHKLDLLLDNEMVSHCFWNDNNTIVGYFRGMDNEDSYWYLNLSDLVLKKIDMLSNFGDGHPNIKGDILITDTYPNKSRLQSLIFLDMKKNESRVLGEFFHSFEYSNDTRCDLHPRLSEDGSLVFFDTIYTGVRKLCYMELSK